MARVKLKNKRFGNTVETMHTYHNGNEQKLIVTYGPSEDGRRVVEAFCASFPVGSDMMTLAIDSSILLSRCLQHGDSISELAETLCDPPSIIGSIARRGKLEEQLYEEENNDALRRPSAERTDEEEVKATASRRDDRPFGASASIRRVLVHLMGAANIAARAARVYLARRRVW